MELGQTTEPMAQPIPRRRFVKLLLGASVVSTLAMVITPIVGFLIPPKTVGGGAGGRVLAGTTDDIAVGQGKVVAMGSKPVIVINGDQGVKAFSAICTHLGCIVGFDPAQNHIVCPCHDGHFSPVNGGVISGPPPTGLAAVNVTVENKQIFLSAS